MDVRRVDLGSPIARQLIEALNDELTRTNEAREDEHFRLDPEEVAPGAGAFLVASEGLEVLGCAAIRRLPSNDGEVKRMYVIPGARGRGVGRHLLRALEREAWGLAIERLVLETTARQVEAVALYRAFGFQDIPPFGEYLASPRSLCLAKPVDRHAALLGFLRGCRYAVEASSSESGTPQSAMIGVAITDRFEMIFDTLGDSRKAGNLRARPGISLVFGGAGADEMRTAQVEGLADEIVGAELGPMQEIYFRVFPDGRERLSWPGLTYFRIRPTWIRYSDFGATPALLHELTGAALQ
ncbi:MAG: GNAT family N-acetyltransferase [Candidatus Eisenbacteria bacterium]